VTDHLHNNAQPRQCGRHADTFRWGYGRGFKDALRIAAREVDDPHVWPVLDRLADRYGGPDQYGLAR
jgi:hypothetical protein